MMTIARLVLAVVVLFGIGAVLEKILPLAQDSAYNQFADTRCTLGLPNAANVLSNLPILLVGLYGFAWALSSGRSSQRLSRGVTVFAIGLTLTAVGSAGYHLHPTNATLVWDRLPLAVAVGGALLVFGTAATSWRPTWPQCVLVASASAGTVAWWALTGSLWPSYVLLQLGGFLTLVCLVLARHLRSADGWWTVVLAYTAFRLFEYFDRAVFVLTGQLVSGHTLKHLASAIAAFALITVVIHLDKRDLNR
jgi:hypothetical protein